MVKVEFGKSKKWYSTHCAICKKELAPTEPHIVTTVTFTNNTVQQVNLCEDCYMYVKVIQGAEQLIRNPPTNPRDAYQGA